LAIHKLKVLAEECIMVGDSISRDIEWARALGMKGVRINRYHKNSKGLPYDYLVFTTRELYSCMKKII
jgi:FMN phosphatase YigB (HAD superfamily)